MEILFSGLATGIDTAALIDALVQTQRIPVLRLQNRQAGLQGKLSSFGDLLGRLNDLEASAAGLKDQSGISATNASVSDDDFFTATSDGRAAPGVYSIGVVQLAQHEKLASDSGFADVDTTVIETGTLSLTVGGVQTDIDITSGTLGGIKDAINLSDAAVRATIVNDGTGTPYHLVITADEAGDQISVSGGTFATSLDLVEKQNGQAAIVSVDGIDITRTSNTITDAIEGVTLNLRAADGVSPTLRELTIETDTEGIKANLQDFVDKYNRVLSFISSQTSFDEASGASGRLLGDFTVSAIQRRLQSIVSGSVAGVTGSYSSLGQIGIRTGSNGNLSIDATDFEAAVEQDLQGVLSIFDAAEGNLMGTVEDFLEDATLSSTGILASRQKAIQSQIDGFQDRIDTHERRIEKFQDSQVRRFAALERLISGLQSQQAFLGARLG